MDKENPWGKDGTGKDVDLHPYRSMIGSLMYLTASRPDIMFAICACARHQVTPKECHLHAVKRIFRYLKGHPKLGLWYPKESPFDLVAYSDSDYGGATQDRKSTTRGCQFLGRRLISWQCKKTHQAATRNRGKAIVNSPQPIYDQEHFMVDADDDETSKEKEIDKLMDLISLSFKKIYKPTNNNLRTSSNTSRANQDNSPRIHRNAGSESQRSGNVAGARETVGSSMVQKSGIQCYNCKEYGHKPKREKDAAYHREKMLLCKQEEAGIQFNAEQTDWKDDTDDESDDQELEAHYMYMAKIQEVSPDAVDSGPIFDTEPEQKVQNDDHYDVFAIECQHPEQSESVHKTYLIEQDAHNVIIESEDMNYDSEQIEQNNKDAELAKEQANNKLSEENDLLYADFKKSKAELKRRDSIEYATEMELECAKVKDKLSAHQDTISILKQQKEAQIKLYKTREDKEIEKLINLENKVKVLDNIVYKTGQSVQTMNMLNNKCRTSFAKPEFLKKAKQANPRLYDIGCYNDNLALMLSPEFDERLNKEMVVDLRYFNSLELEVDSLTSKLKTQKTQFVNGIDRLSREYYYADHMNAILELSRMDKSILYDQKCKSSKELFKIKRSVATIFDGVEQCKQTTAKRTYFGRIDPFIQNTIEANFCPEIRRINADLEKFHVCLKEEMVVDLRYFNSLELEVDSLKSQLETQKTQFLNEIDRLSREYYYADHMNANLSVYIELDKVTNLQCDYLEMLEKCECLEKELSKRVIPITSVSRPQLKSNLQGDKVLRINSRGKKQEAEAHRRNVKLSKNKTFVTTCNDCLNAKTLNVKSVFAMCDACVLIDKHDMCVLKFVAKPLKKTIASEPHKKPINLTRKLYERVSKTGSWWYPKFTPPGYIWKPKSKTENVYPNVSIPLGKTSRTANVKDTMTSRCSIVSNTPLSSNSFAAHRGTVKFRNDQMAPILRYGYLVQGAVTIKRVYYVEGLNYNLFSVGQRVNYPP
nr:uncharacterized mitochondrial protein AtMg00810-like [Tanacetum cinerariifolium]